MNCATHIRFRRDSLLAKMSVYKYTGPTRYYPKKPGATGSGASLKPGHHVHIIGAGEGDDYRVKKLRTNKNSDRYNFVHSVHKKWLEPVDLKENMKPLRDIIPLEEGKLRTAAVAAGVTAMIGTAGYGGVKGNEYMQAKRQRDASVAHYMSGHLAKPDLTGASRASHGLVPTQRMRTKVKLAKDRESTNVEDERREPPKLTAKVGGALPLARARVGNTVRRTATGEPMDAHIPRGRAAGKY